MQEERMETFARIKSNHQTMIENFMTHAEQDVPRIPTIPPLEVRLLRAKLILEEAVETIKGLGFKVTPACLNRVAHNGVRLDNCEFTAIYTPDLVEIVDGCGDLSVVTIGTLSACGVSDVSVLRIIDIANLRKFAPGSYRRADGKWVKPPGFTPPDIHNLLEHQKKIAANLNKND